jgi:hypothetical protein
MNGPHEVCASRRRLQELLSRADRAADEFGGVLELKALVWSKPSRTGNTRAIHNWLVVVHKGVSFPGDGSSGNRLGAGKA